MEEHLRGLLAAALGVPVVWGGVPQSSVVPYVTLFRISGADVMHIGGRSGAIQGRVQVDIYGASFAQVEGLKRTIVPLLSGHRGGPVWSVSLERISDGSDESGGDVLHRISLDFAVLYCE